MRIKSKMMIAAIAAASLVVVAIPARAQWTNFIDCADYNYNSGQFISGPSDGMDGPYPGGAYTNLVGTAGVDFYISSPWGGTTDPSSYRYTNSFDDGIFIESNTDTNRGYFSVTESFDVGWQNSGEWQNYTRVFSNAVYLVELRAGSGNTTSGTQVELDHVTSDPSQYTQTTVPIGNVIAPASGGYSVYETYPFTYTNTPFSSPAYVRLSGTNTLRLTAGSSQNLNYIELVASGLPAVPPYITSISPVQGLVLTTNMPINIAIQHGENPVAPGTINLIVNGTNVTSSCVITTDTNGNANVSYDYGRSWNTQMDVQVSFGDNSSPAVMVTNEWTFTTPPPPTITLSASQIYLYAGQTATNIAVAIPAGTNANAQVEVDVYSVDPSIATPVGATGGVLPLYFPAGGTNVETFSVDAISAGNVQILTSNSIDMVNAALNVAVASTTAAPVITQQPTPASVEQYTGGPVSFSVVATTYNTNDILQYQWQQGTANIPDATNSTVLVSNIPGSITYRVIVSNSYGSSTSSNAVVTALPSPSQNGILYSDTFTGADGLSANGRSPEIDIPGAIWNAATPLVITNNALIAPYISAGAEEMAFIPFSVQPGHVYVVSLDINPIAGGAQWATFGLTGNGNPNTDMWNQNPAAWMVQPDDRANTCGFFVNGFAAGASLYGANPGYTTWKIVLDTTTGTATNGWTVRFVQGWPNSFGNLKWTYVYGAKPTINYIGLGIEGYVGAAALFDNLQVSDSVSPAHVTVQKSGANLELNWSYGQLLQAPSVTGPWTTNSASSPLIVSPTNAQEFYRVLVP